MKKMLSFAKAALLVCTLAVLAMGAVPAPADARTDITIYCSGSSDLCATYEDENVIIDFYLGRAIGVVIEFSADVI